MGGVGAVGNLGGTPPLNAEFAITSVRQRHSACSAQNGFFLMHGGTYDVGVMVIFLFQMVFMDTALTIVTGSAAERWKYAAFLVSSFLMGAFTYPLFANWAWGGGWLAKLGANFGSGKGYVRFRRLGRGARGRRLHRAGAGHHHRSAHRQVHPQRQSRTRSPATIWCWC